LRNVVERAVILAGGDLIAADDLPERLSRPPMPEPSTGIEIGGRVSLEEIENEHIRHVVNRSATLDEAAQILGIDPATLYRKRKKLAT
jgi:NtrC-family two-component system response regulator AlgB